MSSNKILVIRDRGDIDVADLLVRELKKQKFNTIVQSSGEYLKDEVNYPQHLPRICVGGPNGNKVSAKLIPFLKFDKQKANYNIGSGFNKCVIYGHEKTTSQLIQSFIEKDLDKFVTNLITSVYLENKVIISPENDSFASRELIEILLMQGYPAYFLNEAFYNEKKNNLPVDSALISLGSKEQSSASKELLNDSEVSVVLTHPLYEICKTEDAIIVFGKKYRGIDIHRATRIAIRQFINDGLLGNNKSIQKPKTYPKPKKQKGKEKVSDSKIKVELKPGIPKNNGKHTNKVSINGKAFTLRNKPFDFLYFIVWYQDKHSPDGLKRDTDSNLEEMLIEMHGKGNERTYDWAGKEPGQEQSRVFYDVKSIFKNDLQLIMFDKPYFKINTDLKLSDFKLRPY